MTPTTSIILQIIALSFLMIIFSRLFQRKFMMSREEQMQLQQKIQELQDQLRLAQNNPTMAMQINREMYELLHKMMKKQFLPMLAQIVVFFVFIGVLRFFYGEYTDLLPFTLYPFGSGWFALYILTSSTTGLIIVLVKKLTKKSRKAKGQEEQSVDYVKVLSQPIILPDKRTAPGASSLSPPPVPPKSWKKRLNNSSPFEEEKNLSFPSEKTNWKDRL